jgi:hypothetical protein
MAHQWHSKSDNYFLRIWEFLKNPSILTAFSNWWIDVVDVFHYLSASFHKWTQCLLHISLISWTLLTIYNYIEILKWVYLFSRTVNLKITTHSLPGPFHWALALWEGYISYSGSSVLQKERSCNIPQSPRRLLIFWGKTVTPLSEKKHSTSTAV